MLLMITNMNGDVHPLEADADTQVGDFRAIVTAVLSLPGLAPEQLLLIHNGKVLSDMSKRLRDCGVLENDMILAQPLPSLLPASRAPANTGAGGQRNRGPIDPEQLRQELLANPGLLSTLLDRNPDMADAVRDRARFAEVFLRQEQERLAKEQERQRLQQLAIENPFDPELQQQINEQIQQQNRDSQLEHALEFMPELFGHVFMLYVRVRINDHEVKAFVDSGAQSTIVSLECARRCDIERLIDRRFHGLAKGVGVQKIVGRIHMVQMQIGGTFLASSFSVLEDQQMDILIGLDMLRRHQCSIDLKRNLLVIGSASDAEGREVSAPFLSENELPTYARLNSVTGEQEEVGLGSSASASASTPRPPLMGAGHVLGSNASASASSSSNARPPPRPAAADTAVASSAPNEDVIRRLTGLGFNREAVLQALADSGQDENGALQRLFGQLASSIRTRPRPR